MWIMQMSVGCIVTVVIKVRLHREYALSTMFQKRCWKSSVRCAILNNTGGRCTGMHYSKRPWQSALDLFAVNEIKVPIIEFYGKLLLSHPGSPGPFRDTFPKRFASWPLISSRSILRQFLHEFSNLRNTYIIYIYLLKKKKWKEIKRIGIVNLGQ